jgi:hypothetical protein
LLYEIQVGFAVRFESGFCKTNTRHDYLAKKSIARYSVPKSKFLENSKSRILKKRSEASFYDDLVTHVVFKT